MGSGQSAPRKVTMENPDEAVIKITENVVDRLQGASKPEVNREQVSVSSGPQATTTNDATYVSSHQVRREMDREIEKNNTYWENRLKILRDGYKKISAELEEEYIKATKEVNQSLGKHFIQSSGADTNLCKQSQTSVIECYQQNKDRPLLCASEVQKFNECVSNSMNLAVKAK